MTATPLSGTTARRPVWQPTYADKALARIRQGDGPSLTDLHRAIRPSHPLSSLSLTWKDRNRLRALGLIHTTMDGSKQRHWPTDAGMAFELAQT